MGTKVILLICYVRGTHEMISACLSSINCHTQKQGVKIIIAAQSGNLDEGLFTVVNLFRDFSNIPLEVVEIGNEYMKKGREHGATIDKALESISTEYTYILTMDSDAIPMADGWLEKIIGLMDKDICTTGICHPWAPPGNLKEGSMERRIMTQHCYETTHVACQLIRTRDVHRLKSMGIGYADGDDTGLGMVQQLKKEGKKCATLMPTRCPKPEAEFDAEYNRYACIVYEDCIVHAGGFSRITVDGDDAVFSKAFGWAVERILEDGGAEFILEDDNSYLYKFDKEKEVVQEKMQRLFGLDNQRMSI